MRSITRRAAGETVARTRELETVRAFLTGQGLWAIDLVFAIVSNSVMFLYTKTLTLVVPASRYAAVPASVSSASLARS